MQAGSELVLEGLIHCPMARQTGHPGQSRRPDPHRIVRLSARSGAGMPMVQVGFIHYMKLIRRKNCSKRGPYALRAGCQFLRH